MLQLHKIYCITPLDACLMLSLWAAAWLLIGHLIGRRPQETRVVYVPESERPSHYVYERPVDLRTDAVPIESPEIRPSGRRVRE